MTKVQVNNITQNDTPKSVHTKQFKPSDSQSLSAQDMIQLELERKTTARKYKAYRKFVYTDFIEPLDAVTNFQKIKVFLLVLLVAVLRSSVLEESTETEIRSVECNFDLLKIVYKNIINLSTRKIMRELLCNIAMSVDYLVEKTPDIKFILGLSPSSQSSEIVDQKQFDDEDVYDIFNKTFEEIHIKNSVGNNSTKRKRVVWRKLCLNDNASKKAKKDENIKNKDLTPKEASRAKKTPQTAATNEKEKKSQEKTDRPNECLFISAKRRSTEVIDDGSNVELAEKRPKNNQESNLINDDANSEKNDVENNDFEVAKHAHEETEAVKNAIHNSEALQYLKTFANKLFSKKPIFNDLRKILDEMIQFNENYKEKNETKDLANTSKTMEVEIEVKDVVVSDTQDKDLQLGIENLINSVFSKTALADLYVCYDDMNENFFEKLILKITEKHFNNPL